MPTSAELSAMDHSQWELVFVMDGVQTAFVSHPALESLDSGDGRVFRRGLVRSGLMRRASIDVRSGHIDPQQVRVKIEDSIGDLAALFSTGETSVEYLDISVNPGDDLTARTDLHDKHIGLEKIGTSGERRQYPVPLGHDVGLHHFTIFDESKLPIHPPPVTDSPVLWEGRRCGLYRVFRDHISYPGTIAEPSTYASGWRPSSEWELVWWGEMRGNGTVEGRVWTLLANGYESWLQKDLGQLYQTEEQPAGVSIAYLEEHSYIAVEISTVADTVTTTDIPYGNRVFVDQFTGDTLAELRSELQAVLTLAADDASGPAGAWSGRAGCTLQMSVTSGEILFTKGENIANSARGRVCIHKSLWGYLGFDIGLPDIGGAYEVAPFFDWSVLSGPIDQAAPSHGYVVAELIAVDTGPGGAPNSDYASVAFVRPNYVSGVASLDPERISTVGQEIAVELVGGTTVAHFGQLFAPPASDPEDNTSGWSLGSEVNRQGLWLLTGKVRYANTEEEIDEYQVIRASWVNSGGLVSAGAIVATFLYNPENFGYPRRRLTKSWNSVRGGIKAKPLIYLGYKPGDFPDEAHIVMQRIMLSSGTSTGWWADAPTNTAPGYGGGIAVIDPGDNESTHTGNVVRDGEYADLGLGIPASMVQAAGTWHDEAQDAGNAVRCKVAIEPGENAEDILHGLMAGPGWAWSLRNGKYGIWTPFVPISEGDVDVSITRANIDRGRQPEMLVPTQKIREFAPIDKFAAKFSISPYVQEYRRERAVRSLDRGKRYRSGGIEESIEAPYYRSSDTTPVEARLQAKSQFWERRHFTIVRLPLLPSVGRQMWPGMFIRFAHPLPVDPVSGTYGIAGSRAAVIAIEENFDRDRPKISVDLLCHADRSPTPKMHAISARGYGYDDTNDRILVHDNHLEVAGGDRIDSALFLEQPRVGLDPLGGNVRVKWLQWDGAWAWTGTGVVTAVGTTPGSCYLELGAGIATGTYYPCKDTLIVPVDVTEQDAAWLIANYAPIGDEDGEYSMGNLTSEWEDLP